MTQLKAFLAVVNGGSVTAAADELVVTQPSVSSAIGALNRELGCDLFERSGRGVRLTEAGETFVPYAEDIIGLLETGRAAAQEIAAVSAQRLQIAAVTTAAESFVPELMREFGDAHPEIELTLIVGNHEEVVNRVLTHRDDVAICGRPPSTDRLIAEPFRENEIVCITFPEDSLAVNRHRIPAARLADRAWLLRERGSGTRTLNEAFLADRDVTPRTLTLGSNGAIKQAARARLGVSLMSRAAVEAELQTGWLGEIPLTDPPHKRPWYIIRSAAGAPRPAVARFTSFVLCGGAPRSPRA